ALYGTTRYRFPAGHSLGAVNEWSFHARVKNGAKLAGSSDSHEMKIVRQGTDLVLDAQAKFIKPDHDVNVELREDTPAAQEALALFPSATHEGARYVMVLYLPNLETPVKKERRDWVILFESSADRDPLLARTQVEIIRNLLVNAEHDDTFAILTAGTRV